MNSVAVRTRLYMFFFFQAEDGIRDVAVTGVQTCALPILSAAPATACRMARLRDRRPRLRAVGPHRVISVARARRQAVCLDDAAAHAARPEIGRASCRERV